MGCGASAQSKYKQDSSATPLTDLEDEDGTGSAKWASSEVKTKRAPDSDTSSSTTSTPASVSHQGVPNKYTKDLAETGLTIVEETENE